MQKDYRMNEFDAKTKSNMGDKHEKIRILMTLGNTGRGGAQTFAVNLLRNIDRSHFQIDFIVEEDPSNGYHGDMVSLGSKIWLAPRFKGHNYISYIKAYRKVFEAGNYDIIHGNVSSTASIYLKLAKEMGIKTILHSHSSGYRGNIIERIIKKCFSITAKKYADLWFACSESAAYRLFGKNALSSPKYHTIKNGIDVETFKYNAEIRKKIREKLCICETTRVIGNVGSFTEAKNHKMILDVFSQVIKILPDCKLILCGAGSLENSIIHKAKELGIIEKIVMTGNVPNVNEYLMAMDVFLFPSLFEGLGIVAIEAQASGLYCICSNGVANEAKVTDLCEFVSLDADVDVWVQKVLSAKSIRGNQIEAIKKAGYDIVETSQIVSQLYNNLYLS